MSSGRVMDRGYLGDVSKHTWNPLGGRWFVRYSALGMWFGQPERPAVAIVAMNPRSLWTPLLWGWGSTTRSCTVCTFTISLQWRQPLLLHPGGHGRGSTIYGNEFPRASWDGRVTFGEASLSWIAALERCLPFRRATIQQVTPFSTQHRHILDYASIHHRSTGCEPLRSNGKWSTLPVCLSSGSQHGHREALPILTPTVQPMIGTKSLHTGIHDAPAGLCVTFRGAADWKSRQMKPTAQSSTELKKPERDNGHLGGA